MAAKTFHAIGKRKTAIARVYMTLGEGKIVVNEREFGHYFPSHYQPTVEKPFGVTQLKEKFDVTVCVAGGGIAAQADATMYGISKALTLYEADLRPTLKKARLLTRDSRIVERKKYGHKKARKSFQFSKR